MSGNVSLGSLDPCRSVETSVSCCSEIPRGLCRRPLGIHLPTVFTCTDSPRAHQATGHAPPNCVSARARPPWLLGSCKASAPNKRAGFDAFGGFHAPTHKSWSDCRPQKTDKTRWGAFSWSFSRGVLSCLHSANTLQRCTGLRV